MNSQKPISNGQKSLGPLDVVISVTELLAQASKLGSKYYSVSKNSNFSQQDFRKIADANVAADVKERAKKAGLNLVMNNPMVVWDERGGDDVVIQPELFDSEQGHAVRRDPTRKFVPTALMWEDEQGRAMFSARGTQAFGETFIQEGEWTAGSKKVLPSEEKIPANKLVPGMDGSVRAAVAEYCLKEQNFVDSKGSQMQAWLKTLNKKPDLYAAGHSAGGSAAQTLLLYALGAHLKSYNAALLGSVNVFDNTLCNLVRKRPNANFINFNDKSDIVPSVGGGNTAFSTLGNEVKINSGLFFPLCHRVESYNEQIKKLYQGNSGKQAGTPSL